MPLTYTNPVWPGYFADPFVLKWQGTYYAYGTGGSGNPGGQGDGRIFSVLRSSDFVNWEPVGGALEPLQDEGGAPYTAYWAPEVAEHKGNFYMYYSAAGAKTDADHRLRVAVADRPEGPFVDSGDLLLPDEGFTIDASPFRDPKDEKWYLFFAKDFFDERVGTATAVVQLADDMVSTTGPISPVLRASADWQIFERNRHHYDRDWEAWHTVEGPFVVFHEGRYYCFYSGGAWHSTEYGVSYAVADSVRGPYTEVGESGPVVLRGVEGKVLGPGHNSIVLGPDNRTQFVVYHAWDVDRTVRRMCIDPLIWTSDGPRCDGPSWTPRTIEVQE